MATLSIGCKIPWTEVSGGLYSKGSQRVGHILVPEHINTLLFNTVIPFGGSLTRLFLNICVLNKKLYLV